MGRVFWLVSIGEIEGRSCLLREVYEKDFDYWRVRRDRSALAAHVTRTGDQVTGLSRSVDGLDMTDEASVEAHLARWMARLIVVIVATGALGD